MITLRAAATCLVGMVVAIDQALEQVHVYLDQTMQPVETLDTTGSTPKCLDHAFDPYLLAELAFERSRYLQAVKEPRHVSCVNNSCTCYGKACSALNHFDVSIQCNPTNLLVTKIEECTHNLPPSFQLTDVFVDVVLCHSNFTHCPIHFETSH